MNTKRGIVISIDGPAGAGKSTIARNIARELGFLYVDTGAMYRAVTWRAFQEKVHFSDNNSIVKIARKSKISLKKEKGNNFLRIYLDGKEITKEIRSPEVNSHVSLVAKIQGVRKVLVQKQREMAEKENVVMEGRDIGTVVFPKADFKFFLTASPIERAKRRTKEFKEEGKKVNLLEIAKTIERRDRLDSTRKNSPLKKAHDAILVDSTGLNKNQVVRKMMGIVHERI